MMNGINQLNWLGLRGAFHYFSLALIQSAMRACVFSKEEGKCFTNGYKKPERERITSSSFHAAPTCLHDQILTCKIASRP